MTKELYDRLMTFGNDCEPFLTHNYMRTTDLDDGTATVTLPMHTESLNRWGGAHGGILFSLCDVAMGMAIMTLRQEMVVTVNATIDYLAAAAAGSSARRTFFAVLRRSSAQQRQQSALIAAQASANSRLSVTVRTKAEWKK